MPLFPELTTNKRRPDTKHLDAATRMRDALVAAKVLPKVPGQKTVERWARELRQLALAVGEDEMSASVKWVCRNAKLMTQNVTPKIPKVTSPELLRKPRVWDWVTDCIKRDAANQPTKVSKHAARLAREVGQVMHWPKGTADKLAQVVSDSLKNLGRFCRRLDELDVDTIPVKVSKAKFLSDLRAGRVGMTEQTRKLPEKTLVRNYVKGARKSHRLRLQGVKDVVLSMFSGGEDAFIERWLTHFNHRVRDWKDWSGNVNWLAFKPDHQEWDKMVKDRLKEYGGVGMFSLWRQLQRRLADG